MTAIMTLFFIMTYIYIGNNMPQQNAILCPVLCFAPPLRVLLLHTVRE